MSTRAAVPAQRMRGLTLVELLVSLTLGLLLAVATIAGYLGLSEAARMAEAQARMDEDGQAALAVLTAHLRMAGGNPDRPHRSPATRRNPVYPIPMAFAVRGCDGTFANITSANVVQDLTCTGAASPSPDSIAITYEVDRYNTVTAAPAWEPTDCLGRPLSEFTATVTMITTPGSEVDTEINFHVADNRFYIDPSGPTGSPSLVCKGNGVGSNASPLVENVEDLQLTYGTVPPGAPVTNAANIAGYLNASEVSGHPALAALPDDAARWGKVASVRICVIVRSNKPVWLGEGSARYVKCDGTIETNPPDSYLRRAYSTTVVLRNRR